MSRRLLFILILAAIVVLLSYSWHQWRNSAPAASAEVTDLTMLEEANDAIALENETLEEEIRAIEDMNADTQRLLELKSARLQALESQQ